MLRALFEAGVRPDLILGTSVGALNGALVAADPGRGRGRPAGRRCGRARPAAARCTATAPVRQVTRAVRTGTHLHSLEAAARPARAGARRPDLRRARGAVPVLRGQHRAGRRALVHRGPGVDAVVASAAVPGLLAAGRGRRRALPRRRHRELRSRSAGPSSAAPRPIFVLQVGRVDRPLTAADQAVGGRPGVVRDRPPAPVPPGDGRAARRTSPRTCCRPAAGRPKDDSLLAYRDFAAVMRRIDAAYDATSAYLREHL